MRLFLDTNVLVAAVTRDTGRSEAVNSSSTARNSPGTFRNRTPAGSSSTSGRTVTRSCSLAILTGLNFLIARNRRRDEPVCHTVT